MKKIILLITAIVILLCIYHVKDVYYKPYKYALKLEEINNDNYIICNVVQNTGFNWRTQDGELINVVGKAPFSKDGKFKSFDIEFGNNKFILYGNYTDDVYYYGEEKHRTFECESWDIIYPITRNSFNFLYPKSYICEFENDYNNY